MLSQRWRPVWLCALAVLAIWLVAMAGYTIAKNRKMTAEKVRAYASSVDLSKLSGDARADALRRLAEMLNALSMEERRKARVERLTWTWFDAMTEQEKAEFVEATMPTGFKQMIAAFEQLPDDKRKQTIDDAIRRLREGGGRPGFGPRSQGTNGPSPVSKELQGRIQTIGLKTFYSQSSAQTKAELAPLLEEMQHVMQSGRPFRNR
jgi:hypothetical protein